MSALFCFQSSLLTNYQVVSRQYCSHTQFESYPVRIDVNISDLVVPNVYCNGNETGRGASARLLFTASDISITIIVQQCAIECLMCIFLMIII
jgi:hypothetical protein